jgi:cytoskeletal protein CcmA (bactofilin family)
MGPEKKSDETKQSGSVEAETSTPAADALGKPNGDGSSDSTSPLSMSLDAGSVNSTSVKKLNPFKKLMKRFNVYFILFVLLILIAGVLITVDYLGSKKAPPALSANSQTLTQNKLKQLANSNATVGGSGQTLTVQGNSVFAGNVLIQSNLGVAGALQLGGPLTASQLSVSGSSNLASTQANSLLVSGNTVFKGPVTAQGGINVSGVANFGDPVSASQISITNGLTISNDGKLVIPGHIYFGGPTPHLNNQYCFSQSGSQQTVTGPFGLGGGSSSISGSDTSGTVTFNSGSTPQAGCLTTVVFNTQYLYGIPHVMIGPIDVGAANTEYDVATTQTGFSIWVNNAPPANQKFAFSYFISGTPKD